MDANGLRELYDHYAWSMDRLLPLALEVPQEQAAKPWGAAGGLTAILDHIITAERVWLMRWQDGEPPAWAKRHPDPWTVAEIVERWTVVQGETRAFLASLGEVELTRFLRMPRAFPTPSSRLAADAKHSPRA